MDSVPQFLNLAEAAAYLAARNILTRTGEKYSRAMLKAWCHQGRFPNAMPMYSAQLPANIKAWHIPVCDLDALNIIRQSPKYTSPQERDAAQKRRKVEQWRDRYANNPEYREKFKERIRNIYATDTTYREATKARAIAWDKANPDRVNANARRRYKAYHYIKDRQRKYKRRSILDNAGDFTWREWVALCRRFKWRCAMCRHNRKLTVDHIVPLSKGGMNTIDNLQPLCFSCNSSKGDKTIDFRKGEATQLLLF